MIAPMRDWREAARPAAYAAVPMTAPTVGTATALGPSTDPPATKFSAADTAEVSAAMVRHACRPATQEPSGHGSECCRSELAAPKTKDASIAAMKATAARAPQCANSTAGRSRGGSALSSQREPADPDGPAAPAVGARPGWHFASM